MEEASVLSFILFMIIGYAYRTILGIAVVAPVTLMIAREKVENKMIYLINTLAAVVIFAFMPLLALIMTGKSHFMLFTAMFATSVIALGMGNAISRSIGSYNLPWYSRSIWSEIEVQTSHLWLVVSATLITRAGVYLYPFIIGYGYFFGDYPSEQWQAFFLQITLLMLFIIPWLSEFPKTILSLSSENLMTYGRSRIMINAMVSSITLFLLIAFMLWNMGLQGATIELFSGYIVLSSSIIIAFVIYFILCCLIPYMLGQKRGATWRTELAERRKNILDECQTALHCKDKAKTLEKLQSLREKCSNERNRLLATEVVNSANEILKSDTDDEKRLYKLAISDSLPRDPRFRHMQFCSDVQEVLQELDNNIYYNTNQDAIKSFVKEAEDGIKAAQPAFIDNTSPWLAVLLSAVIGIALSMAASTVGHDIALTLKPV